MNEAISPEETKTIHNKVSSEIFDNTNDNILMDNPNDKIVKNDVPTTDNIKALVISDEVLTSERESENFCYQNQISSRHNAYDIGDDGNPTIITIDNAEMSTHGKRVNYSISIFAGPSLNDFALKGTNEEYLKYRNDNESPHIGYTSGVRVHFQLKNFNITTGVDYSVYNQKRHYSSTTQIYSPDDSYYDYDTTWTWIFDPPNIGVPVISGIDSTWIKVFNDKTTYNNGINRLNYIEIPLLLGYQIHHKQLSFEISTGINFGFLTGKNIEVPSSVSDSAFVIVDNFRKMNMNLLIQGKVYYHLNWRTSLYISPYMKRGLNSVYYSDNPVNQKLESYGVNFGINVRF